MTLDKTTAMLNQHADYKETVNPWAHYNLKMYLVQFEYEGRKEWDGPYTLGKANSRKDSLINRGGEEVANVTIKEVEPRQ